MGNFNTNITNMQQLFFNNVTQQDQQNCIATVNSSSNNNTIIINGAKIAGNFTGVTTTVNTDATCLIVSNMQDSISNSLSAINNQTNQASTDWFNGFQFTSETNVFNLLQSVTNNINQINEATCAANTTVSTNNNYVYLAPGTTIGGDFVGVTNTGSASASCSLTNTMINTVYNQAQASSTQTNTEVGMFVAIITAIAAIIGIIVLGVIIMYATGAIGNVKYDKKDAMSQEDLELAAFSNLGITTEQLRELQQLQVNPNLQSDQSNPSLQTYPQSNNLFPSYNNLPTTQPITTK
jgi:hypothetical protein